jgi:hypothetical protein
MQHRLYKEMRKTEFRRRQGVVEGFSDKREKSIKKKNVNAAWLSSVVSLSPPAPDDSLSCSLRRISVFLIFVKFLTMVKRNASIRCLHIPVTYVYYHQQCGIKMYILLTSFFLYPHIYKGKHYISIAMKRLQYVTQVGWKLSLSVIVKIELHSMLSTKYLE